MFRTDAADNVAIKPAYTAIGTPGYHTGGPPGTVYTHEVANHVQEEIASVVELVDEQVLDKADDQQLKTALWHIRGIRSSDTGLAYPTDTLDFYVVINGDNCEAAAPGGTVISGLECQIQGGGSGVLSAIVASFDTLVHQDAEFCFAAALGVGDVRGTYNAALATQNGPIMRGANSIAGANDSGEIDGVYNVVFASKEKPADTWFASTVYHSAMLASENSKGSGGANELQGFLATRSVSIAGVNLAAAIATESVGIQADRSAALAAYFGNIQGGDLNAVIASQQFSLDGDQCAIIAADDNAFGDPTILSTADNSALLATFGKCIVASASQAIVACSGNNAGGLELTAAGTTSAFIGCAGDAKLSGVQVVALGSNWSTFGGTIVDNTCVVGGDVTGKQWRLQSGGGTAGTGYFNAGAVLGGADYAECFELASPGSPLPVGALVALVGRKAKLAEPGDRVRGVVSADPMVLGNAAPLGWQGALDRNEWGEPKLEVVECVRWRKVKPTVERVHEERVRWKAKPERVKPTVERWVFWPDLPLPRKKGQPVLYDGPPMDGYDGPVATCAVEPPNVARYYNVRGKPRVFPAREAFDAAVDDVPDDLVVPIDASRYRKLVEERVLAPGRQGYDGPVADLPADLEVPDDAEHYTTTQGKVAKGFDPAKAGDYVGRQDRLDEWAQVALLGQLRVRVAQGVAVGDYLAPGEGGVAVATDDGEPAPGRPIEVLEVLRSYTKTRGCAVALCFVG